MVSDVVMLILVLMPVLVLVPVFVGKLYSHSSFRAQSVVAVCHCRRCVDVSMMIIRQLQENMETCHQSH